MSLESPPAEAGAQAQFPQYQCHKKVWALKITCVTVGDPDQKGNVLLHFDGSGFTPRSVTSDWYVKHGAKPGGYWVQYEGGYESYSPADVFEAGYTLVE